MNKNRIIRVGSAQWDVKLGDISFNLDKAERFLNEFAEKGVELAVFPEMWSCGFDYRNLGSHADVTPDILERLGKISDSTGITICGSLPDRKEERIYNSLFVIGRKGFVHSYSKIHLFTPTGEDRHFTGGENAFICHTEQGVLGLIICYDLRFPELCRSLVKAGAEIIICCAQWPETRINHWNTLLSARAIENQIFVVASNRCGKDSSIIYGGSSRIISPLGRVVAECGTEEASAVCDLDFEEMTNFRAMMPCLEHIKPQAYEI